MRNRQVYQVSVPAQQDHSDAGLHIFTGEATSPGTALRSARKVHDAALAAQRDGLPQPAHRSDGWSACGMRPGWQLDWSAATACLWKNPYGIL
ncbi:hypothetical protein QZN11_07285 [Streptomyces gramineus]|uniref:hypothetical protein n=1 Tax=Streptomyces gramineus TaxID=910542 RepID=UPI00398B0D7E